MKKLGLISSAASLFTLLSASAAFAQVEIRISDIQNAADPSAVTIGGAIAFVVGAAVVFGIIAALLFIVIGAFQWITSGGDKGKVESARNHIVAAIIGLLIIVLSLVIMNFVLQIIGIGSLGSGFKIKTLIQCPAGQARQADGSCR